MKALLVDDERPVRNVIRLLGEWDKCGITEVYEAQNYEEAILCLEQHAPELVITDIRMPGHDGLELMSWLHENYPDTVVIVISANNDFNYAIAAMRSGALDYLLKPIQPGPLNKLLEKAAAVLTLADERQEDTRYRLDKNEKIMMSLYLEGNVPLPEHSRLRNLMDPPFGVLVIDLFCVHSPKGIIPEKRKVLAALEDYAYQERCGWVFAGTDHPELIFCLLHGDAGAQENTTAAFRELLQKEFGIGAFCDLRSNGVWKLEDLPCLAAEMMREIRARELHDCFEGLIGYEISDVSALFESAARKDSVTAENVIGKWIECLRKVRYLSEDDLRNFWLVLCRECGRGQRGNMEYPAFLESQMFLPVLDSELRLSLESMRAFLVSESERLAANYGEMSADSAGLAQRVEEMIRKHCTERLSLSDIAALFYRSPEHIARVFKEEYGESVVSYIARVRIERAQVMLKTTGYKIAEIAHRVGYEDEKYFCRVFRKVAGVSPAEYRQV